MAELRRPAAAPAGAMLQHVGDGSGADINAKLREYSVGAQGQPASLPAQVAFRRMYPAYYEQEFARIQQSGEAYKGKWNWAAFFFGPFWAITKGLWGACIVCLVVAVITAGIGGVVYWDHLWRTWQLDVLLQGTEGPHCGGVRRDT